MQTVLELACAAQRHNGQYVKDSTIIITGSNVTDSLFPNKDLMLMPLGINRYTSSEDIKVPLITTNKDDQALAAEIQNWFKRAIFNAVQGDNDFLTKIFAILNSDALEIGDFGYVACLPHVYKRDVKKSFITKTLKLADNKQLGFVGDNISDLDCEILEVKKSNNYDAYNVLAIIDNKIVSWMSTKSVQEGPAVLIKGKIKTIQKSFRIDKCETRLNYVKVAQ